MISEKNKKILFVSISAVLIIVCAVAAFFITPSSAQKEKQAQTYEVEQYVVGVYQEKIAVFAQGDTLPIEIYDVYVTTLPQSDQKSLRKGISVQGKTELKRMIEDYTS